MFYCFFKEVIIGLFSRKEVGLMNFIAAPNCMIKEKPQIEAFSLSILLYYR